MSRRWRLPRITRKGLPYVGFALALVAVLVALPLAGIRTETEVKIIEPMIFVLFMFVGIREVFGNQSDIPRAITIRPAGEGKALLTGRSYGGLMELEKGRGNWFARTNRVANGAFKWSADVPVEFTRGAPGAQAVQAAQLAVRIPGGNP